MKLLIIILIWTSFCLVSVGQIKVNVKDNFGNPLPGASIKSKDGLEAVVDESGTYIFNKFNYDAEYKVIHVGYITYTLLPKVGQTVFNVVLEQEASKIDEVIISTGYYDQKRSNLTGASSSIDMKYFGLRTSNNLMDRLENISPSLQFDRSGQRVETQSPSLRLRGQSSLRSETQPLIVVDGFAYYGSLDQINPDEVESITLLKDASSAAIWGARSGNGVIVIKTKEGKSEKVNVQYRSSNTYGNKPDITYGGKFVDSRTMLEIEETLFKNGFYAYENSTLIPSYVSYLKMYDDGLIDEEEFISIKEKFSNNNIYDDIKRDLYHSSTSLNHILSVEQQKGKQKYFLSLTHNFNDSYVKGNEDKRFGGNTNYSINISDKLQIGTILSLAHTEKKNNGFSLFDLNTATSRVISPYSTLIEDDGTFAPLNIEYNPIFIRNWNNDGKLDWMFRPLNERDQRNILSKSLGVRTQLKIDYSPIRGLNVMMAYNNHSTYGENISQYDKDSYYVRNLVNKYTQQDGSLIVPYGGIYDNNHYKSIYNTGRLQAQYSKVTDSHSLDVLSGYEISEIKNISFPSSRLYGFNPITLTGTANLDYTTFYVTNPSGWQMTLPSTSGGMKTTRNRSVSYYFTGRYGLFDRYVFSISSRWDASNLYGVRFNQKGVPLWSTGINWKLFNENFYPKNWPEITMRIAYGLNGNTNNSLSASPQILTSTNATYQMATAQLMTAGNPNLRWEKVKTTNIGLDFSHNNRLKISIDAYRKFAIDLLGPTLFDPTTGISVVNGSTSISNLINYASMKVRGLDLEAQTTFNYRNIVFSSNLMISALQNKVIKYMGRTSSNIIPYLTTGKAPIEVGESIDQIYTIPFYGLSQDTGQPLTDIADTDYGNYFLNFPVENMIKVGSSVPTLHGNFTQSVSLYNFTISCVLAAKFGYYYRRGTINYYNLFSNGDAHSDFYRRWQHPGDEEVTSVPAMPATRNSQRDLMYHGSDILMVKGDHIRLDDLSISYNVGTIKKINFIRNIEMFANTRHLGIIWKKSDVDLDPDVPYTTYPSPMTISLGMKLSM